MDKLTIIVDQFDNSNPPILHVGYSTDCSRENILVDERCSLCWEKRFGTKTSKKEEGGSK